MIKAVRCEFSGKEMFYVLFRKKKCPKCGGKMTKNICFKIVDGITFTNKSTPLYIQGRKEVKTYYYTYTCEKCGCEFLLNELVK